MLEKGTGVKAEDLGNYNANAEQFFDVDIKNKMSKQFEFYTGSDLIAEFNKGLKAGDMLVGKIGDGDNSRNHCEFIYENATKKQDGTWNSVYEVFGWGQVKKVIKSQANLTIDGNFLKNSFDRDYKYSILYRKKVQ